MVYGVHNAINLHLKHNHAQKVQNLTVSFLNVCSLRRKTDDVQEYMSSRGIHILAMAKTWLKPDISDGEVHIPLSACFVRTGCTDKEVELGYSAMSH